MALTDTMEITSDQALIRAWKVEAQRTHKEVVDNKRDAKEFNSIRQDKQKHDNVRWNRNR